MKNDGMSQIRGKSVLVTGAGGFIGSHLAEALVRRGAKVRAFVHYNSRGSHGWLDESPADIKGEMEIAAGCITDAGRVRDAMRDCEIVFHLAALIGIPYSYAAPQSYVQTNVVGTMNVLEACREYGTARLLHTSTSEVYGTARYAPIDEAHPLNAQSPYAATKTGADQLALSYERTFGTPVVVVRPFNTFGPRQSPRAIIPTVLGQLVAGAGEIRVGSLHPTRDFNFVSNTVDGFIAAAEAEESRVLGEVFNLGSGREISIGDLIQLCMKVTGRQARVVTEAERVRPEKSEVERLIATAAKAEKAFGYKAKVGLEEGLQRVVDTMAASGVSSREASYRV